jgi:hypothetical protein
MRLLAKDRENRPRDMAEVLGLIDAIRYVAPKVRQSTVPEQPSARAATIAEGSAAPSSEPASSTPKFKAGRYYKWAGLACAVGVVAAIPLFQIEYAYNPLLYDTLMLVVMLAAVPTICCLLYGLLYTEDQ